MWYFLPAVSFVTGAAMPMLTRSSDRSIAMTWRTHSSKTIAMGRQICCATQLLNAWQVVHFAILAVHRMTGSMQTLLSP